MIEEINLASNKLRPANSKSTTTRSQQQGDPLSQIVRVLNSHLAQLQTIDSGARDLAGKVEDAQREARVLGEGQGVMSAGNGGGWIEGFGRSYLGRS